VYECIYSCSRTIISRSTTFGFFDEPAAKAATPTATATATAALERDDGGAGGAVVWSGRRGGVEGEGVVAIATAEK